ncbi:unnamed protein product [Clonostachys rosea]|uniref:Uncharacterized protein n=1 Tax=Bionectria ochroleuca TaxID=29856 RepID=A0ABY6V0M2_BIOOC|nr:unnamed protein product [Clonostachys rosea]
MANSDRPQTPPPDSNLDKLRTKHGAASLKEAATSSAKPDAATSSTKRDATASYTDPNVAALFTENDEEEVSHWEHDTNQRTREELERLHNQRNEQNPSPEYHECLRIPMSEIAAEELRSAMGPFNGGGFGTLAYKNEYKAYSKERFRNSTPAWYI